VVGIEMHVARPPRDFEILDDSRRGRRHVHRRLVRLERDQRILGRDRIAGLHQNFDDRHVLEIADVGDFDFDDLAHV